MHVAVDAHETGVLEGVALRLTAAVQAEVEAVRLADGEDVVVERIMVGEADRRTHRDDDDVRRVRLVGDRDLDGDGLRLRRGPARAPEIQPRAAPTGRGPVALF